MTFRTIYIFSIYSKIKLFKSNRNTVSSYSITINI